MRTAHCKFTAANINDLGAGSVLPLQRLHRAAFSTASTDVSPPYLSIRSLTATYPTWPHKQLNTKWFWYIHRRTIMFCSRSHSYDFSIPFLNYPSDALWGALFFFTFFQSNQIAHFFFHFFVPLVTCVLWTFIKAMQACRPDALWGMLSTRRCWSRLPMLEDLTEALLKIVSGLIFSTLGIAGFSQPIFKVLQNWCKSLRSTSICLDELIVIQISTGNSYLFYDSNQSLIGEAKFSKVLFSKLDPLF